MSDRALDVALELAKFVADIVERDPIEDNACRYCRRAWGEDHARDCLWVGAVRLMSKAANL